MSSTTLKSFILCLVYLLTLAAEELDLTCSNSQDDQCKHETHLLEKSVSDINSKLDALESTLREVVQKLKKLNEKKLKLDVHYLETVLSCYHQCFHSMLTEEKRKKKHHIQRIEDLEQTDSCLHGCMHLHPYLS